MKDLKTQEFGSKIHGHFRKNLNEDCRNLRLFCLCSNSSSFVKNKLFHFYSIITRIKTDIHDLAFPTVSPFIFIPL